MTLPHVLVVFVGPTCELFAGDGQSGAALLTFGNGKCVIGCHGDLAILRNGLLFSVDLLQLGRLFEDFHVKVAVSPPHSQHESAQDDQQPSCLRWNCKWRAMLMRACEHAMSRQIAVGNTDFILSRIHTT